VEKFSGKDNFQLWKLKMQDLLVKQGLRKGLVGKLKRLAGMSVEDCDDLDSRALSTIRLCLEDEVLFNINGEEITTSLWSKMESIYMKKYPTNKIFLKKKLYNLRMKEGAKIVDHLNVFNTLIFQLSSMEVKYEDEDKEVTLLCYFPESSDHMVTSMWFNSTNAIEYDIVVGDLLAEKMRRRSSKETSTA
jgi:hypothetical protein